MDVLEIGREDRRWTGTGLVSSPVVGFGISRFQPLGSGITRISLYSYSMLFSFFYFIKF